MEAPDLIYVCIPQRLNLSTFKENSKYVGLAYNDKGNLRSPQIEEYIRKDALNKMLDDAITDLSDGSLIGYYQSLAYQDIKDKINSM